MSKYVEMTIDQALELNRGNKNMKVLVAVNNLETDDIAAFVSTLSENIGEAGKYVHLGLTSTDVKDTAMGYMLKQASDILIKDLEDFRDVLRRRAVEFKYTPCIGRTHGIHAEATTFGLKLCNWLAETERNIERMKRAKETIAVGKISGAVGTYADVDPFVEKYVCEHLGIAASPISSQTLQRDRHADFVTAGRHCQLHR